MKSLPGRFFFEETGAYKPLNCFALVATLVWVFSGSAVADTGYLLHTLEGLYGLYGLIWVYIFPVVRRERFGAIAFLYSQQRFPIQWGAKELLRVSQPSDRYVWYSKPKSPLVVRRFPKIGYPHSSSNSKWDFSYLNHPFWVSHIYENPQLLLLPSSKRSQKTYGKSPCWKG